LPETGTDRITHVEQRQWDLQQEISKIENRVSSLETTRDNARARVSTTPAWVFGTIAAIISVASFLLNLWMAGMRP
jgi:hypothetical protein